MARLIPAHSCASVQHGIWFVFHQDAHVFALWVSTFTGKEELYVDGSLVAAKRKLGLTSVHCVSVANADYTITLSRVNQSKGRLEVTLQRAGKALEGWRTRYVTRRSWAACLLIVGVGGVLSFFVFNRHLPLWLIFMANSWLIVLAAKWSTAGSGYGLFVEPMEPTPDGEN